MDVNPWHSIVPEGGEPCLTACGATAGSGTCGYDTIPLSVPEGGEHLQYTQT